MKECFLFINRVVVTFICNYSLFVCFIGYLCKLINRSSTGSIRFSIDLETFETNISPVAGNV